MILAIIVISMIPPGLGNIARLARAFEGENLSSSVSEGSSLCLISDVISLDSDSKIRLVPPHRKQRLEPSLTLAATVPF